ncbi:MAG: hypothetical protein K2X38_12450 [Gemmataceae bacterium]|nr:hypothetical protein [Gemmataceae bacterium]
MLEQNRVEFLPWTGNADDGTAQPIRRVVDAGHGGAVGAIRFEGKPSGSRWTWSRPPKLVVMQAEEDGLCHMATLRRPWLSARRWKLFDAEDQIVGLIHGLRIQDPLGYRFAWAEPFGSSRWRFRDLTGRDYAVWMASDGSDFLEWLEPKVTNPFLRMLVLGTVLCRVPIPETKLVSA